MSDTLSPLLIGKNDTFEAVLLPALGNRHGLITGATGTGKTVTLQRLAEQFSTIGVPVFMADVKGDLTGISQPGQMSPKLQARLEEHKLPTPQFTGFPVMLWDVFGKQGHPVRATVSDMGPLLLARMMGLNETQEGVLNLTFKVADDNGLLLLDSKDLRAMLQFIGENAKQFTNQYGNVSSASVGAIQRNLLTLEQQGAERFFGEPMLKLSDMMRTAPDGRGYINVLMADQLMNAPRLYGTFLLWLLAELFEQLPEVGDLPKPKMVFFFDEAHLLFDGAPKALLDKIEQVVRLIRSKGVGVYFITQNPLDVPDSVLGQLGNRVQHALRAFTPRDQKAVRTAAETMRANPALNTEQAIGMAEDFLTQARLDHELFTLHLESVELRRLVRTLIQEMRRTVAAPMRLQEHGAPIRMVADRRLLRQAIANTVTNAVRHAGEHATITISVSSEEDTALITVADNGRGMTRAQREALFTPFRSQNSLEAPVSRGVGLGMVVTKQILTLHGGSVLVDSLASRGTSVYLTLPIRPSVSNGLEPGSPGEGGRTTPDADPASKHE